MKSRESRPCYCILSMQQFKNRSNLGSVLLFPREQEPRSNRYTLHSEVSLSIGILLVKIGFTRSKRRKCLWFSKIVLSLIALPIQEFYMIFFPYFLYVECGAGYTYGCLIPHQLLSYLKSPFLRNLHFSMRATQQIKNTLENGSHIKKLNRRGIFILRGNGVLKAVSGLTATCIQPGHWGVQGWAYRIIYNNVVSCFGSLYNF